MTDSCAICHREHRGSLLPRTGKLAAKYPLDIQLINDIGGMVPHYSYIDLIKICIDCRPKFEIQLRKFFESIALNPKYSDYEKEYVLNKERYDAD